MIEHMERFDPLGRGFGFVIFYKVKSIEGRKYRVEVEAFEIVTYDENTGQLFFEDAGCQPTDDICKARPTLEGRIRHDGCSDFSCEDAWHFCEAPRVWEHAALLIKVYERAGELMGGFL